jgi:hypothetical protein
MRRFAAFTPGAFTSSAFEHFAGSRVNDVNTRSRSPVRFVAPWYAVIRPPQIVALADSTNKHGEVEPSKQDIA